MLSVESLSIAVRGLLANRLRSALTMLGILIGVGAVIILVAVGNGSSLAVQKRIDSLGTNTLTIFRGGFGRGFGGRSVNGTQSKQSQLTLTDLKALQDRTAAPDIASASPVASTSVTATYQGATYQPGSFVGTDPAYFKAKDYTVAEGRFFDQSDYDAHAKVVVLGATVVTQLFGTQDPVGSLIQMNGTNFTVIGVTAKKGTNGPQDQDDVALAPLTTVQDHLTGTTAGVNQILVQATSSRTTDAAQAEITSILDARHNIAAGATPDFSVLNQTSLLQTSQSTNRVFTILLGVVAAISLLVGGIGVMNIMLVTVTERTREIGIRKAIGARRRDILGQFLIEAVLLCVAGGFTGVAAGLAGSHFKIVGVHPVVAPYSVFLAFGVAVAVGLFFGIYPANRAASLRPIDALRYE